MTISAVRFDWLGDPAPALLARIESLAAQVQGECLPMDGLRALHRAVNARLTARGFVTSRVLIPEQDLVGGELVFTLAPGRIETTTVDGLSKKQVNLALPSRRGRLLNLRDLEQAIENLGRVRGLDAAFDIRPGTANGESTLAMTGTRARNVGAALIVNEKYFGSTAQGSALANVEVGAPFGLTDRLLLSVNSDLDRTVSDRAWGAGLDYDLGVGYWLLGAGFSRQAYFNDVQGILQSFEATGETDTARLEIGRVLYRSNFSRVGTTLLASESDVLNELNDATIQVSSYSLSSWGVRIDTERRWTRWQAGSALTLEYSEANGPATSLFGGGAIADVHNQRVQLTASALYPFSWQQGTLRFRLDSQYTTNNLFPLQRWSLASRIRGFDDISITGNSGHMASAEYAIIPALGKQHLVWRPYVNVDVGWIPKTRSNPVFERLAGVTAGSELIWKRLRTDLQLSAPLHSASTVRSDNNHVLRASMTLTW